MDINMKEELYYYAYNENYTENIKDLKIKKKTICICLYYSFVFVNYIFFANII